VPKKKAVPGHRRRDLELQCLGQKHAEKNQSISLDCQKKKGVRLYKSVGLHKSAIRGTQEGLAQKTPEGSQIHNGK